MKVTNIAEVKRLLQVAIEVTPGDFEVVVTDTTNHRVGPSIVVRSGPAEVRLRVDAIKVWPKDKVRINLDTGEVTGELSRETDHQRRPRLRK